MNDLVLQPLKLFFAGLNARDWLVFCVLVAVSAAVGFVLGRRGTVRSGGRRTFGAWRFPQFQNRGEALVSHVIRSHFGSPDYHLMNHVTIQLDDGSTQVDHILVSRRGVFVIETKDFNGWIFANAADATWTQVLFRKKFKFQNPILQNYRHVRAVQSLLDFLPPESIKSVVVFTGNTEFKTARPEGVVTIDQVVEYLRQYTEEIISRNRLQFCVGRLETARQAISRQTDVEHVQNLARKYGTGAE